MLYGRFLPRLLIASHGMLSARVWGTAENAWLPSRNISVTAISPVIGPGHAVMDRVHLPLTSESNACEHPEHTTQGEAL